MNQWAQISERIGEWTSPLRPSPEDVAMFQNQLESADRTLLLGVTSALQPLASVVIDHNPQVIATYKTDAVLGDWKDLPFVSEFDAVIGDGCLTVFQEAPELFFKQVRKVLKPGGRLILRVFIAPESKEDLETIFKNREGMGFHAFKWKVAHALGNPYVPVKELYETIKPVWNHPTLSVYRDSDLVYYFPKLSELPSWEHIQFGTTYELAERCPVVTWKF